MKIMLLDAIQIGNKYIEGGGDGNDMIGWLKIIISPVIAVLLFWAGFRLNRWLDRQKKKELQKEKLRYFKALIIQTFRDCKFQIEYYKKYEEVIRKNSARFLPGLTEMTFNDTRRIVESLNQEDYYISYISYFKLKEAKDFHDIVAVTDSINELIQRIRKTIDEGENNWNNKRMSYGDIYHESMQEIFRYLRDKDIKEKSNDFWRFLDSEMSQLFTNWQNAKIEIEFIHEKFFSRMESPMMDFSLKYPHTDSLLYKVANANFLKKSLSDEANNLAKDVTHYTEQLSRLSNELVTASSRLMSNDIK